MLVIQDPTDKQSSYLLESLLEAFRSADRIAGAFAFASSAGVRLFTEDEIFRDVANRYPVDLVVGIDAVTNERALDSLSEVGKRHPNVQVRAFLNPRPEALFHPKFCWTKEKNGGHLIIGSGNLTEAGLLRNWEAYSLERLDLEAITAVESSWAKWVGKHNDALLPLDNAEVRRMARSNNVLAPEGDLPTLVAPTAPAVVAPEPVTTLLMTDAAEVLIAEIPQSGDRWKQANFHLDDYVNFFGVQEGVARLVIFRHVNADGTMAEYERNRPPVTVKSRNFRFELAAAAGLPYPSKGRPIGVFVRMGTKTFFYRLVLPNDGEFPVVNAILQHRAGSPTRTMRSVRLSVAALRAEWPNSPFWKLPA